MGWGVGGCSKVVGPWGMNGHLVRIHRGETLWDSGTAFFYTKNLKESLLGWLMCRGGIGGGDGGGPNSSPSMCCSHYILTHIFSPDWWKSLHVCLTWMSERWVCGWISNSVFGKWKHIFWIKKMDTMNPGHVGRGGGWSVSVTVRQCTPVLPTHLYRVAVNSGNPQGHGTKGD